jgi:hypothetical protein
MAPASYSVPRSVHAQSHSHLSLARNRRRGRVFPAARRVDLYVSCAHRRDPDRRARIRAHRRPALSRQSPHRRFLHGAGYELRGEQWRIDAQFLKWHYWATLLGLESQYRLERLEGRYRDVADQNSKPLLAHALAPPAAIDIGGLSGRLGRLNFLADATYGSSTYHDIDTASRYLVYKSPTGIFTRSGPRTSAQRGGEPLAVDVRRGCGESPGLLARAAALINRSVDRAD